jgi:hypothetical protein
MSVIATAIEANGVTRIFFDCRAAAPNRKDEARIVEAIERAGMTMPEKPEPLQQAA